MKEKPMIVPVALSDSNLKSHSGSATCKDTPVCHFKFKDAEVTFYNGANKYILHAVYSILIINGDAFEKLTSLL